MPFLAEVRVWSWEAESDFMEATQSPALKVTCCRLNLGMKDVDRGCKAVSAEEKEAGYGRWHVLEVALELLRGLLVELDLPNKDQRCGWVNIGSA